MKIRRLNESVEFNFNNAASSGNWPYKMSIETYVDLRDSIAQMIETLDQDSVFAIARDATKLGLNIDQERLYYSPDATIETNVSPEKINQFRNIVMRYSNEQVNEASTKKFYIDEIVSAPGGKTETERHSFATCDELKQYVKDANLTKDDIANCGGCDLSILFEGVNRADAPVEYCPSCGAYCDYTDTQDNETFVRYRCPECGNLFDREKQLKEGVEKLHTKPNGEYLVKADSGKGYTAFSRDNVAIGGINTEDADSDDKAIDKFKKNEYSECLNEEYFDTHEFRILKYEEDIPELMAGMHDDYMEGRLAAEFYAKALEKVYNVLAECDHKYTLSQGIKTEDETIRNIFTESTNEEMNELFDIKLDARGFGGSGNNVHVGPGSMPLTASIEDNEDDETLNEGSEKYYAAKYTAVDNSGNKVVKKICFRCDGTIEDAENEVDAVIKEPYTDVKVFGSVLKGIAEKDGFELVESVLHEDKETISKFAQLAASHKFKNLKTQLLPEDKNGIRKCESCGNFYFGKQLLICTKCGSTEIDPGRDCKCRHCGYEFAEDHGKCVTCGGEIVKNNAETNRCKHCGNLYDIETGELIKQKTTESVLCEEVEQPEWFTEFKAQFDNANENQRYELIDYDSPFYDKVEELYGDVIGKFMEEYSSMDLYIEASTQAGYGGIFMTGKDENGEFESVWSTDDDAEMLVDAFECDTIESVKHAIHEFLYSKLESAGPKDEYDDEYDNEYDESLEECSGIKAHKVIMGEDIDDSIEFDDLEGIEGVDGDKTEDIEFVMAEYIPESFLIDSVKKIDSVTYEVSVEGKVVIVKFDPKWSEYVYTIDDRGPYSHRSYEFISRDIYDFVMSQRSADYELDDLDD